MQRNIIPAQKRTQDFYRRDALAQTTNQIKYNCFFFAWHRKHKKIISSRSKNRNEIRRHAFLDVLLFFHTF